MNEAIKLAVTMHTRSKKLQMSIIAQNLDYQTMVEKARAIELTKKKNWIHSKQVRISMSTMSTIIEEGEIIGEEIISKVGEEAGNQHTTHRAGTHLESAKTVDSLDQISMTAGPEMSAVCTARRSDIMPGCARRKSKNT